MPRKKESKSGRTLAIILIAAFLGVLMLAVAAVNMSEDSPGSSSFFDAAASGDSVGVVEIQGMILDSKETLDKIDELVERRGVDALVVRIDSPGGTIGPTQEIYAELRALRNEGLPVVASLGQVAASGGYYIAAGADKIVSNPGTLTGSIGVIMEYLNFKGALEKIHLKPVVIKSGRYKDIGNPMRDITKRERKLLDGVVGDLYDQFLTDVVDGRGMTAEEVKPYADGRIFTGRMALGYKLVDRLGGLEVAVAWAGELAGIEGQPKTVYPKKKPKNFFEALAETSANAVWSGVMRWRAQQATPSFYFADFGLDSSGP